MLPMAGSVSAGVYHKHGSLWLVIAYAARSATFLIWKGINWIAKHIKDAWTSCDTVFNPPPFRFPLTFMDDNLNINLIHPNPQYATSW